MMILNFRRQASLRMESRPPPSHAARRLAEIREAARAQQFPSMSINWRGLQL
jgi:hypothetical protein